MISIFIDLGSSASIMFYDMWEAIDKLEILPWNFTFKSFNNTERTSIGACYVKILIQDAPMYELFYVADK